jgi:hypothetical protein
MAKQVKTTGSDPEHTTNMVQPDDNPEYGQYDRSHKQKLEKEHDDRKALEHREALEEERKGKIKVTPKVNMVLKSGVTMMAGEEAHVSPEDMAHIEQSHGSLAHRILQK